MQTSNTVLPNLGPRLALIATMVPKGAAVCDVGTDHGLLPSYLYLKGIASAVFATDIADRPLARAAGCVKRYGADGVRLLLCDGLDGIKKGSVDTVIIAGMGGEVISGIIDRCDFAKDPAVTFILQPMTGADHLRRYLAESGFDVVRESAVCEHRKVQSVMLVRYSGNVRDISETEALIGMVTPETEAGAAYIKKQYDRCLKCTLSLESVPERLEEYTRWNTAAHNLKKLLEDQYGI